MTDTLADLEAELAALAPKPKSVLDEIWDEATGPKQVWKPTANIALIYSQTCSTCGQSHQFFMGWFTEQRNPADRFTRRLVAGRGPGLPPIVERQNHGAVEFCPSCVEAQVLIDAAAQKAAK